METNLGDFLGLEAVIQEARAGPRGHLGTAGRPVTENVLGVKACLSGWAGATALVKKVEGLGMF